jgi:hypothetical protein
MLELKDREKLFADAYADLDLDLIRHHAETVQRCICDKDLDVLNTVVFCDANGGVSAVHCFRCAKHMHRRFKELGLFFVTYDVNNGRIKHDYTRSKNNDR